MTSEDPASGYESEMRKMNRGHALFNPHPGYRDEAMTVLNPRVDIGDVGYIVRGTFRLLFNVHRDSDDSRQLHGVPLGFIKLPFDPTGVDRQGGRIGSEFVGSRHDVSADLSLGLSAPGVGGASSGFNYTHRQGASLAYFDLHELRIADNTSRYEDYFRAHYRSWITFLRSRNYGSEVRLEDLVLVTGCERTRAWATAWSESNSGGVSISLEVQPIAVPGASAHMTGSLRWHDEIGVHSKSGPPPEELYLAEDQPACQDDWSVYLLNIFRLLLLFLGIGTAAVPAPTSPAALATSSRMPASLTDSSTPDDTNAATDFDDANGPADVNRSLTSPVGSSQSRNVSANQCIFIRGFRARTMRNILLLDLKAAAGPHILPDPERRAEDGPSILADADSDRESDTLYDIVGEPLPAPSEDNSLLAFALSVVAEHYKPSCPDDLLLMHDDDLKHLLPAPGNNATWGSLAEAHSYLASCLRESPPRTLRQTEGGWEQYVADQTPPPPYYIGSFLLYIVSLVNKAVNAVARGLLGLDYKLNPNTDDKVNDHETPNEVQFAENVDESSYIPPSTGTGWGIHEDAQQGKLTRDALKGYLRDNPGILHVLDPVIGRAPLATAAVAGFADEVEELLKKGAKADAPSRDGETALLLVTRPRTSRNRPRIVQLLLSKMPSNSIDATTPANGNNTPLMFAVLNGDVESIRLLVKAGAGLTVTNDRGLTAKNMAKGNATVTRALGPENEDQAFAKLTNIVVSFLLYIVTWVNKATDGIARRLFGVHPELNESTDVTVNNGETPNRVQFVENVDDFVNKDLTLERFFKGKPNYIQELAKKATELRDDPSTPLGNEDLLPKTIKVTLHQQVIYCDDSSSMKRDGRWVAQVGLVKRIARITTRILPEGDGVALRFINQDVDNSEKLGLQQIESIVENMSWQPNGDTPIGTYLRSKILEPLVYSKLQPKTLARPLLISVITDGMPSQEKDEAFVEAIKECGNKLQQAGFPRDSVKFMIGQIGTAKSAASFLKGVGEDKDIADTVFVTTDQLDERLSSFKENEGDLDRWLIETLFSAIKH